MYRRTITWHRFFAFALVAMLLLASPAAMMAGNNKHKTKELKGVIPPFANAFGQSYEEWAAEWWQWVFSLPAEPPDGHPHPLFDNTGADCAKGQDGKVWFIGGIFVLDSGHGEAVRKCTIPPGTALFFPILNSEWDNLGVPEPGFTNQELIDNCEAGMDNPQRLSVTLDKAVLKHPSSYRIDPTLFTYTTPQDNSIIDFFLPGNDFPNQPPGDGAIACGYYVMLAPLSKGEHKLNIAATNADNSFSLDVTYILQVGKPKKSKH